MFSSRSRMDSKPRTAVPAETLLSLLDDGWAIPKAKLEVNKSSSQIKGRLHSKHLDSPPCDLPPGSGESLRGSSDGSVVSPLSLSLPDLSPLSANRNSDVPGFLLAETKEPEVQVSSATISTELLNRNTSNLLAVGSLASHNDWQSVPPRTPTPPTTFVAEGLLSSWLGRDATLWPKKIARCLQLIAVLLLLPAAPFIIIFLTIATIIFSFFVVGVVIARATYVRIRELMIYMAHLTNWAQDNLTEKIKFM
eukprot:TRINITY_DN54932_c0_g2_i1.p1 TRINITY_DN54932_c0_g2~~TRINITY_DN54932_c0_g2_i1.p1  ORF type:complete len:251 (+),score=15.42 TRINITY_DN54932_c0_g2_i1:154-906(+)